MLTRTALIAASMLAAVPAFAATYSAKPASPAAQSRVVVRDTLWTCGPSGCVGATNTGRPLVLCQALARQVGRLESFAVDGRPLATAELERCNASARAKGGAASGR